MIVVFPVPVSPTNKRGSDKEIETESFSSSNKIGLVKAKFRDIGTREDEDEEEEEENAFRLNSTRPIRIFDAKELASESSNFDEEVELPRNFNEGVLEVRTHQACSSLNPREEANTSTR